MVDDKLTITLRINDQSYKLLNIPREKEQLYREAADLIKDTIRIYRAKEPDASSERILAMAAFHISYNHITMKDRNDTMPYVEKLKQWESEIDEYFKETEKEE